ncbi:peptidase family C50-domain-containing protein [Phaeosphaeria sp. MPI-PUGE-AT-0046c]|nr:peptidase family C50-domain-containing protein [Phaeosphaeria sp. MPI-PUGE-AT-0046c]
MATKDEPTRLRIDSVKADLRSTTTCSAATVATLHDLLLKKQEDPAQKENVRAKTPATARRRAATTAAQATANTSKQDPAITLSPRDKYILATDVANTTLKTLADALKNPSQPITQKPTPQAKPAPSDDARNSTRPRAGHAKTASATKRPLKERSVSQMSNSPQKPTIRRSSSYSSFLTVGPDSGLVHTAECSRIAFAYLGTPEATKVLGKDKQELQLESGILALVGKLVALGLDALAVKEIRQLKKRLERFPSKSSIAPRSDNDMAPAEKENLASLLGFSNIAAGSPALPLVVNLQTYTLRVIARLSRPRIVEGCWEHLKLDNPCSPANLIQHTTSTPSGQAKAARQLETLAQTILALCPQVCSSHDEKPLQPSPETVLRLQHLAFAIRKKWWTLAKHQGDLGRDLLEPFAKCLIAFARRSRSDPGTKYSLGKTLYLELSGAGNDLGVGNGLSAVADKTLSSLAQAAGSSEEALQWLGSAQASSLSSPSQTKDSARLVRIAIVTIEALLKDESTSDLEGVVHNALETFGGSLNATSSDLDALFLDVNALRRAATRLLVHPSSTPKPSTGTAVETEAIRIIAASIHFTARLVGVKAPDNAESKRQQRHYERIEMVSKCIKSTTDSALMCCKSTLTSIQQWQQIDVMLQECSHIINRIEEDTAHDAQPSLIDQEMLRSLPTKLSNAYWAVYLQLRKARLDPDTTVIAVQRSINLVQNRSSDVREGGHLTMKLEHLGDTFDSMKYTEKARKARTQCIQAFIELNASKNFPALVATKPLQQVFSNEGPLSTFARILKSHHRNFVKSGTINAEELAFFDDVDLPSGIRGALLEWQLSLYIRTLSVSREWDAVLDPSIEILLSRLQNIYVPERYPIRRLRLTVLLLQLAQSHAGFTQTGLLADASDVSIVDTTGSEDEGLTKFGPHLKALYTLKNSLRQSVPSRSILQACFTVWETLVNTTTSWSKILDCVDDVDDWVSALRAGVDFLNAKGEEYLALPVLTLLVKIGELQTNQDLSELVTDLCALGLQFLRLGYTGKAGLSLSKAEARIGHSKLSTEASLRWHIAYAEYLARLGNISKGLSIITAAQKLATADKHFMDMAKSSTSLSERIRFNRIISDAAYVQSLLSTVAGDYKDAARHVKQCVVLNRRLWAVLESRSTVKKAVPVEDSDSTLDSSKTTFDPLSSMRNDKGTPLVMSVTHDALDGADFWSLVPALYRGFMQHSQVFAHQGLLNEAIYMAEQAEKIASAIKSPTLMMDNASWRADCWAQSGRPDKAQPILDSLKVETSGICLSVVGYQSAVARVQHWSGRFEEEAKSYSTVNQLLEKLTSSMFIRALDTFTNNVDDLADQLARVQLDTDTTQSSKAATTTRGRKAAVKIAKTSAPKTAARPAPKVRPRVTTTAKTKSTVVAKGKSATSQPVEQLSSVEQCSILHSFRNELIHRQVLASLAQDNVAAASALLAQLEDVHGSMISDSSHLWASIKTMLAQSAQQIAENIAINTLPESTIAFPAINLAEQRLSDDLLLKRSVATSSTGTKSVRAKKVANIDFADTLRAARDRLVDAHAACAKSGPNHMFQQVSMALGTVTVLLSAVSTGELGGSLHPLYAAYMGEIPKTNALRLTQESVQAENEQISRDGCLRWPISSPSNYTVTTVSDFQKEYIDTIPTTWTAISLALNESRNELYITRYESGLSPFVLRLPLARHASRDMDEEEFSFEDGKRDFDEIIELSDFSTRTAKDMTSREARQQWWTEREALDTRLQELLLNMQNIWLGGFRGIFSQHDRQPALLASFRKSLENVLNQHLPSRRKKSQLTRPVLDTRILELFIGLGDATDEDLDLDEALMDLIYFVVDILHFNGERNAYDEIDFEAMVVETQEALQAYHSAAQKMSHNNKHVILLLDNNLHGFPWESLPCLEKLSISRLPSLAALRERLLAAQQCASQQHSTPGHYISGRSGGTSILNPSGDLSHTSKTLKPRLDELDGDWTHIANRAPTEKEFEDSLREKDLVLYFGHGSGAQFVRSKAVRRLYTSQQDGHDKKPGCATTFLFGCSSVHLTENGIYEPSGMLASYLTAGAPAVVGMLWDVTDKDCDRFAVKAGELWGLWPEPQEEALALAPPKTPGRKTKGKSRVAQLVDEVESVRAPSSAKKAKKAKMIDPEPEFAVAERRRGLGLDECVRDARKACVLRYLNGAAAVVYGIPVYLE